VSFAEFCRRRSVWVLHYDCGSCNGCDIEVVAALTPLYDAERFGVILVGSPRQADVLLVTGTVNHRNQAVLRSLYDQMPEPKAVVAVGACALTGGIFHDSYNVIAGADHVVPVDVFLPGCPPKPERILDALLLAVGRNGRGDHMARSGEAGSGTGAAPRGGVPLGGDDGAPRGG
jgi:ech hydrogenase subunit C